MDQPKTTGRDHKIIWSSRSFYKLHIAGWSDELEKDGWAMHAADIYQVQLEDEMVTKEDREFFKGDRGHHELEEGDFTRWKTKWAQACIDSSVGIILQSSDYEESKFCRAERALLHAQAEKGTLRILTLQEQDLQSYHQAFCKIRNFLKVDEGADKEDPMLQSANVEVAENVDKFKQLMQRYSVMFWKGSAGAVRFLCEDLLNGYSQLIFLVKSWPTSQSDTHARGQLIFTCISIAVGLVLSLVGPLKDFYDMRSIEKESGKLNIDKAADPESSRPLLDEIWQQGKVAVGEPHMDLATATEQGETPQQITSQKDQVPSRQSTASLEVALSDHRVSDFLAGKDPSAKGWQEAHRCLVAAGGLYWMAMAFVPIVFQDKLKSSETIPLSALMYFGLITSVCIVAEIWVIVHTREGLHFFQAICRHMSNATSGKMGGARAQFAIILSLLGRFDTFSDILFATMLFKHDEITWFSIWGHTFHLPLPLHWVALFAVVFGVYGCQALPGMTLLYKRKTLPMAFKFNEFNYLLAVAEYSFDMCE